MKVQSDVRQRIFIMKSTWPDTRSHTLISTSPEGHMVHNMFQGSSLLLRGRANVIWYDPFFGSLPPYYLHIHTHKFNLTTLTPQILFPLFQKCFVMQNVIQHDMKAYMKSVICTNTQDGSLENQFIRVNKDSTVYIDLYQHITSPANSSVTLNLPKKWPEEESNLILTSKINLLLTVNLMYSEKKAC